MKRATLIQVLLGMVALGFAVLVIYPASSPKSSTTTLQQVGEFGLVLVALAVALLFFLRPPQRKPGEEVRF